MNRVVSPEELVPVTQKLAAEMATCVPHVLRGYKRLIDEGFGMPLEQALAYELDAAIASAREMTAETLAERRTGVLERGRDQDD